MGGRFPDVGICAAAAMSVLGLACATRGQSQPDRMDSSAARDATEPPDARHGGEPPKDDASTLVPEAATDEPDATMSAGDVEGGGEVGSMGDDATSDGPPMADAGPEAEASADGAAIGDAEVEDGAPSDGAALDASPCGTCESGFQCGASATCVSPTGVPAFGHVFVIVLGNQPLSAIQGSASAPYLNGLMSAYPYATNYTTADHPSLPNYIELTSGNTQQIACDCKPGSSSTCTIYNCSAYLGACTCPQSVTNLGDELDVATIRWREYAESMGSPCNPSGLDGGAHFAVNHIPFLYYDDVFTNAARCQDEIRDYGDFATDVAGGTIRFALVSPNLCHDMHDNCGTGPVKQGDQWLSTEVPALLSTPGFAPGGTDVLFIVGDQQADVAASTAPIPLVVVSPLTKKGPTSGAYNHHSLLATIEDGLGVLRLGSALGAAPIADVWK